MASAGHSSALPGVWSCQMIIRNAEEFAAAVELCKVTCPYISEVSIVRKFKEKFEVALSAAPQVGHSMRLHFWAAKLGVPDKAAKLSVIGSAIYPAGDKARQHRLVRQLW